jgi:hypothetical protein
VRVTNEHTEEKRKLRSMKVYVVRKYMGHSPWAGSHPAKSKDKEFKTLHEAQAYRSTLTGMVEIFQKEVAN